MQAHATRVASRPMEAGNDSIVTRLFEEAAAAQERHKRLAAELASREAKLAELEDVKREVAFRREELARSQADITAKKRFLKDTQRKSGGAAATPAADPNRKRTRQMEAADGGGGGSKGAMDLTDEDDSGRSQPSAAPAAAAFGHGSSGAAAAAANAVPPCNLFSSRVVSTSAFTTDGLDDTKMHHTPMPPGFPAAHHSSQTPLGPPRKQAAEASADGDKPRKQAAAASGDGDKLRKSPAKSQVSIEVRELVVARARELAQKVRAMKDTPGRTTLEEPIDFNPEAAQIPGIIHPEAMVVRLEYTEPEAGTPELIYDVGLTIRGEKEFISARNAEQRLHFIDNLNQKAAVDHVFELGGAPLKLVMLNNMIDAKRRLKEQRKDK